MGKKKKKNGFVKFILFIAAVALVLFLCWKAGWILNGDKNEVSEQEAKEAIHESVEELREDLQEVRGELQELHEELRDALQ